MFYLGFTIDSFLWGGGTQGWKIKYLHFQRKNMYLENVNFSGTKKNSLFMSGNNTFWTFVKFFMRGVGDFFLWSFYQYVVIPEWFDLFSALWQLQTLCILYMSVVLSTTTVVNVWLCSGNRLLSVGNVVDMVKPNQFWVCGRWDANHSQVLCFLCPGSLLTLSVCCLLLDR